jgi:hypothetical protein
MEFSQIPRLPLGSNHGRALAARSRRPVSPGLLIWSEMRMKGRHRVPSIVDRSRGIEIRGNCMVYNFSEIRMISRQFKSPWEVAAGKSQPSSFRLCCHSFDQRTGWRMRCSHQIAAPRDSVEDPIASHILAHTAFSGSRDSGKGCTANESEPQTFDAGTRHASIGENVSADNLQ